MKGFTLIELLATIVILSIVSVIATAIVGNAIKDIKKEAYIISAIEIVEATKLNHSQRKLSGMEQDVIFMYENGIESSNVALQQLSYMGKKPEEGTVFSYKNGDVAISLFFDGYCTIKFRADSEVTIEKMTKTKCKETLLVLNYPHPVIKTNPESDFDRLTNISFTIDPIITHDGHTVIEEEWENILPTYPVGEHTIRVRTKFSDGFWGPWGSKTIDVAELTPPIANITMTPTQISNVTNITFDHSTSISFNRTTIVNQEWQNKLTNYSVGNHTVRLRVQDSNGLWSDWKEINFDVYQFINETVTYDYISSAVRTYTIINGGVYRLEVFGAQGGSSGKYCVNNYGGSCYGPFAGTTGSISSGEIRLNPGDILYIYLGEQGKNGTNFTNKPGSIGVYGWAGGGGGGGGTVVRLNDDVSGTKIIGAKGGTGGNAQGSASGSNYAASGAGGYSSTDYIGVAGYRNTGGVGGGTIYTELLTNPTTQATGRSGNGRFILTRIFE